MEVDVLLGGFSTGLASELGNMIIPLYMVLERLHMKYRTQSRDTESKRDMDKLDQVQWRAINVAGSWRTLHVKKGSWGCFVCRKEIQGES